MSGEKRKGEGAAAILAVVLLTSTGATLRVFSFSLEKFGSGDRRLYRLTHKTFEEYTKDRFGYNRAHAYQLIQASGVIENLSSLDRKEEMSPIWRQKMPASESQCRELASERVDTSIRLAS